MDISLYHVTAVVFQENFFRALRHLIGLSPGIALFLGRTSFGETQSLRHRVLIIGGNTHNYANIGRYYRPADIIYHFVKVNLIVIVIIIISIVIIIPGRCLSSRLCYYSRRGGVRRWP